MEMPSKVERVLARALTQQRESMFRRFGDALIERATWLRRLDLAEAAPPNERTRLLRDQEVKAFIEGTRFLIEREAKWLTDYALGLLPDGEECLTDEETPVQ